MVAGPEETRPAEPPPEPPPSRPRRRARWPRWLAGGALALVAAAVATWWLVAAGRAPLPTPPRPSADAFKVGGRPLPGFPEQRAFFTTELPDFVLALDRNRPRSKVSAMVGLDAGARREELSRQLSALSARAHHLFGPEPSARLAELGQASLRLVFSGADSGPEAQIAGRGFNQSMANLGLAYQLDVSPFEGPGADARVLWACFLVEWVERYQSGDAAVRALRWQRLDTLTFSRALLGYTREDLDDALVLMDRIDAWLVREILPALAPDASLPLVDDATRDTAPAWAAPLEARAGEEVRRQLAALVGDPDDTRALGVGLARRWELFGEWNRMLGHRGVFIDPPERYSLDLARYAPIEKALMPWQWRELGSLQDELESGPLVAAHELIREALARSVERHEVQHRFDYAFARIAVFPAPLGRYLGLPPEGETPKGLARDANAELSAYLAELGRSPALAKVNLASLARFVFDHTQWGGAECYAALVVFDEVARRLGRDAASVVDGGAIDRERLAATALALLAAPDDVLAAAARQAWEGMYGEPLPALAVVTRPRG